MATPLQLNLDKIQRLFYTYDMPEIKTLIENDYIHFVLKLLPTVKKSLYMIIYLAKPNLKRKHDDVKAVLDLIIKLSNEKIETKIMIDSLQSNNPVSKANAISYNYLKSNGIDIKATKRARLTHSKLILIDDNITITGSHNLTNGSLHKNREVSILITDEKTNRDLKDYFLKNFYEAD